MTAVSFTCLCLDRFLPNIQHDRNALSLLKQAADGGHSGIAAALIEAGANVSAADKYGRKCRLSAVHRNEQQKLALWCCLVACDLSGG